MIIWLFSLTLWPLAPRQWIGGDNRHVGIRHRQQESQVTVPSGMESVQINSPVRGYPFEKSLDRPIICCIIIGQFEGGIAGSEHIQTFLVDFPFPGQCHISTVPLCTVSFSLFLISWGAVIADSTLAYGI
jgi:hypothetical protein